MATYKVLLNAVIKAVVIRDNAASTPSGYTSLGTFVHDEAGDTEGEVTNHSLYKHVRKILFANSIKDPSIYTIYQFLTGTISAPVFTKTPSMRLRVETYGFRYIANDGAATNNMKFTREFLLDGVVVGRGASWFPNQAGNLSLRVTATGPGGTVTSTTAAIAVTANVAISPVVTPVGWPLFGNGGSNGGGVITPPLPEFSLTGEILPQFFAKFNNGVIPEAFTIAPQKIWYAIKTPHRIGTIEPNTSLDWQGDPIFPSMSVSDNDRTLDPDLDYLFYGKHPTDARKHLYGSSTGVPTGVPFANFMKLSEGRHWVFRGGDTLGRPFTHSRGVDVRIEGMRGDFTGLTDADFMLANGQSDINKPAPIFGKAYCVSKGQRGNNRDCYVRLNTPSSGKLSVPIIDMVRNAGTGLVRVTLNSAFPNKLDSSGNPIGAGRNVNVNDFFIVDGSTFNGQIRNLRDYNWKLIVTAVISSTVFDCTLDQRHNVPSGGSTATGGTAFWFTTGIGTHADGSQYAQSTGGGQPIYQSWIMEDHCTYEGNYDAFVGANSVASDCFIQLTRSNFRFLYVAPSDTGASTYRMGQSTTAGLKEKFVYQLYIDPRPLDSIAFGLAFSANGGEGVTITADGLEAASVPSRPEVKGIFKRTPALMPDFAIYENCGVDWVHPGESDVNPLGGVITDLLFVGSTSINESIGGNGTIGLIRAVTTNYGGDIDLEVMSSNVSLNQWFLHGARLVRGRTQFDYETTPIVNGLRRATVTIKGTIRGSNPVQEFTKTFSFIVNDDVASSGMTVNAALGGHYFNGSPSSTTETTSALNITAAAAGRYVIAALGVNASTSTRDFGATGVPVASGVTIDGTAAKRLVRRRKPLDSNPTANFAFAGLFIAPVSDVATTTTVAVGMGGSYAAMAADVVTLSGLSSDEPFSTAFAENGVSGGAAIITLDIPTDGKAVLTAYYSTATNGNKRTSTLVVGKATPGTYQFRATPTAGTFGPMIWEINTGTVSVPVWTSMVTWGAYDNVTTYTYATSSLSNGAIAAVDGHIEDSGSGATVVVGASFGAAS